MSQAEDVVPDELGDAVEEFAGKTAYSESRVIELEDSDTDEETYRVHGVAIGEDDVTLGQSGIRKLWPEETLRSAADSLAGKKVVTDHENSALSVVGKVLKSGYKSGVGVLYEAELANEELAAAIANEWLEVSIRGYHDSVDELDEAPVDGEDKGETESALRVTGLEFANISIVETGAAGSNTLKMGSSENLSGLDYPDLLSGNRDVASLAYTEPSDEEYDDPGIDMAELEASDEGSTEGEEESTVDSQNQRRTADSLKETPESKDEEEAASSNRTEGAEEPTSKEAEKEAARRGEDGAANRFPEETLGEEEPSDDDDVDEEQASSSIPGIRPSPSSLVGDSTENTAASLSREDDEDESFLSRVSR